MSTEIPFGFDNPLKAYHIIYERMFELFLLHLAFFSENIDIRTGHFILKISIAALDFQFFFNLTNI